MEAVSRLSLCHWDTLHVKSTLVDPLRHPLCTPAWNDKDDCQDEAGAWLVGVRGLGGGAPIIQFRLAAPMLTGGIQSDVTRK